MQPVYLLCGIPGTGKTWAATQLTHKFDYVRHDEHLDESAHVKAILKAAKSGDKPVLTDSPFGERLLKDRLTAAGATVIPVFVLEHPNTIKKRYEKRENKKIPKHFLSRTASIPGRAKEWDAFIGTSEEVLEHLKHVEFDAKMHKVNEK